MRWRAWFAAHTVLDMSPANAEYRSDTPLPEYTLTRRARMRNIRMRVVPPTGEVKVSAPYGVSRHAIEVFVASKAAWIALQQERVCEQEPPLAPGPQATALDVQLWQWLEELLPLWCDRIGVEQPHVTLRIMRTRWGSCRKASGRITLNTELGRRGFESTEYVLVHELCHLIELNHGPHFYALMDLHLPDWRERKAQLRPL